MNDEAEGSVQLSNDETEGGVGRARLIILLRADSDAALISMHTGYGLDRASTPNSWPII